MTTKKVLELACLFLGKQDLTKTVLFDETGSDASDEDKNDVEILLKCLNLILSEIAIDYLPIVKRKTITLSDKKVDVKSIDSRIQEVLSLKDGGINVPYKILGNDLYADANCCEIEYKVHPTEVALTDTCEDFAGRIAGRVLAYGVCMEYCFISLLYDDAQVWENKFKNALMADCRKKSELRLKKRRFI